jgi:uncharacterized protein
MTWEDIGWLLRKRLAVRVLRSPIAVGLLVISFPNAGLAQAPGDFFRFFNGMAAAAIAQSTREAWGRLPQAELACIDLGLRRSGASLDRLIAGGVQPADPRVANLRSTCADLGRPLAQNVECPVNSLDRRTTFCDEVFMRDQYGRSVPLSPQEAATARFAGQEVHRTMVERSDAQGRRAQAESAGVKFSKLISPTFDCGKATDPTEATICSSYELSELEQQYVDYYTRAKRIDPGPKAQDTAKRLYALRRQCGTVDNCIKRTLTDGIDIFAGLLKGKGVQVTSWTEQQQAKQKLLDQRRLAEQAALDEQRKADQAKQREKDLAAQQALDLQRKAQEEKERQRKEAERTAAVQNLTKKITAALHVIEEKAPSVQFAALKSRAEEAEAKLAAVSPKTPLEELQTLSALGDDIVQQLLELDEFDQVSKIATQRVERIDADLKTVVSDLPYIDDIKRAAGTVVSAQQSGSLQSLQSALSILNRTYELNKGNLQRDRFATP